MKKRYFFATLGAFLMLVVEWISIPFLISSGGVATFVKYVLYAPWTLGTSLLISARDDLGLPLPSGGMSPLPRWLNMGVLAINWCSYAALGFLLGLKLGSSLGNSSKPVQTSRGSTPQTPPEK